MDNITLFKNEFGLILIGAIIFTASFLWKDLLSDVEDLYFPKSEGLGNRFVFTLITTILLICLAVYFRKLFNIDDNKTITKDSKIKFDDTPIADSD